MRIPATSSPGRTSRPRSRRPARRGAIWSACAVGALSLVGCSIDALGPTPEAAGATQPVRDLTVHAAGGFAVRLGWTQVADGTGAPARFQVRRAVPPLEWETAVVACEGAGDQVGAEGSCTIAGLEPSTAYEFQVMTLPHDGEALPAFSEVVTGRTGGIQPEVLESAPSPTLTRQWGVWISRTQVRDLPTSGSAWENVKAAADGSCGTVDLSDQESSTNVCVMAKALVFARTGTSRYRSDVVSAIKQIVGSGTYSGTALALGRELGAYVIAADLIDLKRYDSSLNDRFRSKLRSLRTTYASGGGVTNLIECHERRPNNWGAHCGATRAAIAVYLGDSADLARTAQVFKGYLGDRSSYRGFKFGSTSWQCDSTRPVGINPSCSRSGISLSGVLPDDQRRGGSFKVPPPNENYVWEALQGLLAQAVILHRAGYDVWAWESRALRRAVHWLYEVNDYPASGDDRWQPYVINRYYGTGFPTSSKPRPGKNVGWTDWTHAR